MIPKPNLLIIMELKQREFVPKVLLSKVFAQAGWRVTIGTINSIPLYAKELQPSIILHKGLLSDSKKYQSMGHKLVILDEEGGITTPWSSIEDFCRLRYPQLVTETPDLFLAPNEEFANHVRKLPGSEQIKIEVTGWPRIDTWFHNIPKTLLDEALRLKGQHGHFYLYVSSFGAASEKALSKLARKASGYRRARREHRANAFRGQVKFLRQLAGVLPSEEKLIIRPHIIESEKEWCNSIGQHANIEVHKQGDVLPWIIASEGVISWGSTTAVQSALQGKMTLQYDVEEIPGQTDTLSYSIPRRVETPADAAKIFSSQKVFPVGSVLDKMEAEGWIDRNEAASLKVLKAIEKIRLGGQPFQNSSIRLRGVLAILHALSFLKYFAKKIGVFKGDKDKANDRTVFENMPGGLSESEILSTLEGFLDQKDGAFKVTKLGIHIFSIETD